MIENKTGVVAYLRKVSPIPSEREKPAPLDKIVADVRSLNRNITETSESLARLQVANEMREDALRQLQLAVLNLRIALGRVK